MSLKDTVKYDLVVVENFLEYVKGEVITDVKKVTELVESEWQAHFVKKSKDAPNE